MLHLALPTLSAELGADSIKQLWIVDIYAFMIAGLLLTMGALGDLVGRRRLLMAGMNVVAAIAAVVCCLLALGAARLAGRGVSTAQPAHEPGLLRDSPEGT